MSGFLCEIKYCTCIAKKVRHGRARKRNVRESIREALLAQRQPEGIFSTLPCLTFFAILLTAAPRCGETQLLLHMLCQV